MIKNDRANPNPSPTELKGIAMLIAASPDPGVKGGQALDIVDNVVDAVRDAGNSVTNFVDRITDNAVANAKADAAAVREGRATPVSIEITQLQMSPKLAAALAKLDTPQNASVADLLEVRRQLIS